MKNDVLLIGVNTNNINNYNESIEEMKGLCIACNYHVKDTIIQNLRSPNKNTFINTGKIEEIKIALNRLNIKTLIVDHEISPAQLHNLESELKVEIIDKTYLILKIFETRATSKEAVLQVEIAKLNYLKPRLMGAFTSWDRQRGGNKNRGRGEQISALEARNIDRKITSLKKQLSEVSKVRDTQRNKRNKSAIKTVALVGYTNAGKSSILNAIMNYTNKQDKTVYEKDQLFATLTTSTRKVTLENKHEFTISDTVGFISDLPHQLIEAFASTLEEVVQADLLLHILDYSNPDFSKHKEVSEQMLKSLHANQECLIIYNKCDKTDHSFPFINGNSLYLSSKSDDSIKLLLNSIDGYLYQVDNFKLFIPYQDGYIINELNKNCLVLNQKNNDNGYDITIETSKDLINKYQKYLIKSN